MMRTLLTAMTILALAGCDRSEAPATNEAIDTSAKEAPSKPVDRPNRPSFDCARADGQAQELVCTDASLAAMDREVDRLFRLTIADTALDDARRNEWVATQRGWIKGRDDCWKADELRQCVMTAYAERIHRLRQGSQPARAAVPQALSTGPFAYTCKGLDAAVGATFVNADPGAVFLEWGLNVAVALDQVTAASGAKYEGRVNGATWTFWTKGNEAILTMPGQGDLACRQDAIG
jgi:uncharacterized protein